LCPKFRCFKSGGGNRLFVKVELGFWYAHASHDTNMVNRWPQGSYSFWCRVFPWFPIWVRCTKHEENPTIYIKPPGNMLAPRMARSKIGSQCSNLVPIVWCMCHQIKVAWIWEYQRCFTYCKEFGWRTPKSRGEPTWGFTKV